MGGRATLYAERIVAYAEVIRVFGSPPTVSLHVVIGGWLYTSEGRRSDAATPSRTQPPRRMWTDGCPRCY